MTHHNLILIKGGAYLQVKKALRQWIDLYANDLANDIYMFVLIMSTTITPTFYLLKQ